MQNLTLSQAQECLEFDGEIGRHPLLEETRVDGVMSLAPQEQNERPFESYMPFTEIDAEYVRFEYEHSARGGMTPAVSRLAESPMFEQGYNRADRVWEPAEFREKVKFDKRDIVKIREIGTLDQAINRSQVIDRKFGIIESRLRNRMEWMRRQALFEGKVTAEDKDGNKIEVPYQHAPYFEKTLSGNDLWSDDANSTPVRDMQKWLRKMRDAGPFTPGETLVGADVMFEVLQNDRFEDIVTNNGGLLSMGEIKQRFVAETGIPAMRELDQSVQARTVLTSDIASGSGSLKFERAVWLEPGDRFTVIRAEDSSMREYYVDDVTENFDHYEVSLQDEDGNAVTTDIAFNKGDAVKWSEYVMPEDHIAFMGQMNTQLEDVGAEAQPDAEFMNNWADVASTKSYHTDLRGGGTTGIFQRDYDKTDEDPPRFERMIGTRALPRVHYPDAWFFSKVI